MKAYIAKYIQCKIEEVEIERDTEFHYWVNGKRHPKNTRDEKFSETYEGAKQCILYRLKRQAEQADHLAEIRWSKYREVYFKFTPNPEDKDHITTQG